MGIWMRLSMRRVWTAPAGAGRRTAKGMLKLRGDLKAPQVLADLTASGLQWQALTINRRVD
jgi:autotransporter translocation and assembly factor TamB